MRSAWTRSRNATPSASPGPSSSTTSWSRTCGSWPRSMKKAFHIARSGRPGPVVVDIPKDVSFNKTAYTGYPDKIEMRSYNPVRKGHGGQIRKALQLLLAAKRPYIYTGGGVILGNATAGAAHAGRHAGLSLHQYADGPGRLPGQRPQVPGHAGHARHHRSQQRHAELRRAAGRGRALRRPRDRQPQALRARTSARSSTSTSTLPASPSG